MFKKTMTLLENKKLRALNVAEKPSVAKIIKDLLSQNKSRTLKSHSKYNPIFQFEYKSENQEYIFNVTSIKGHMMSYSIPYKYKKWEFETIDKIYDVNLEKDVSEECKLLTKNLIEYAK